MSISSARAQPTAPKRTGINVAQDILTANPDLKAIYSACGPPGRRRRPGDQERQARSPRHPGRLRLLLRRGGSDRGGNRRRLGGAVPGQDGRARRRRPGQGDQGREGRVADRLGRRPGHQGKHGQVQVSQSEGRHSPALDLLSDPQRPEQQVQTCSLWTPLFALEPGTLQIEQRPAPRSEPGQALVRPRRVGICGTDYHIFEGKHPFLQYPRVMGHELAVEVVEAPADSASRPARSASSTPTSPADTASPVAPESRTAASTSPCSASTRMAA